MKQVFLILFLHAALVLSAGVSQDVMPPEEKPDHELSRLTRGMERSTRLNRIDSQAIYAGTIAFYFQEHGQFVKALDWYGRSLSLAREFHDSTIIAGCLLNMGMIYKNQGLYDKALGNLQLAAAIFERLYKRLSRIDDELDLASCYNSMGDMYRIMGHYGPAQWYYKKCLSIFEKQGNQRDIARSLNSIGELFSDAGQYDSATVYLGSALKIKTALKDTALMLSSMLSLGQVYTRRSDPASAEQYFRQIIALAGNRHKQPAFVAACNEMGALYYERKQYAGALEFLARSLPAAREQQLKPLLLRNYDLTRHLYRALGDLPNALSYDELFIDLKESILNEEKNKALVEMEIKYETAQKEQQLLLLTEEEESQRVKMTGLIGIVLLSLCMLIIVGLGYLRIRKARKKIGALMRELNHRIKNNLQLLNGLLGMQQERIDNSQLKEALEEIKNRINAMIHVHRKLYNNDNPGIINLREYIEDIVKDLAYTYRYDRNNLKLITTYDDIFVDTDKAIALGLIVNEVISNSFKHAFGATASPELRIDLLSQGKNMFVVRIKDNGSGIDKEKERSGSFGMKLIRLLSEQLKARLRIADENGTCYEFILEK